MTPPSSSDRPEPGACQTHLMADSDPHTHVDSNLGADAAMRNVLASTFGLAGDLPSVVTSGCGLQVPRATTATRPDRVTCLPCREHASRMDLQSADQVERLAAMPGSVIDGAQAREAATRHRELARRFSDTGG